mmetsp:Transcript_50212/g.155183  ORF Transcript_50212/g.155183 Transcript_50212/m.155183 type:complete len:208 (+) Transcript_50212:151-774(+)
MKSAALIPQTKSTERYPTGHAELLLCPSKASSSPLEDLRLPEPFDFDRLLLLPPSAGSSSDASIGFHSSTFGAPSLSSSSLPRGLSSSLGCGAGAGAAGAACDDGEGPSLMEAVRDSARISPEPDPEPEASGRVSPSPELASAELPPVLPSGRMPPTELLLPSALMPPTSPGALAESCVAEACPAPPPSFNSAPPIHGFPEGASTMV